MRRKDREITDFGKITEILRRCTVCRLGFCDEGEVYIVPVNVGADVRGDKVSLWFHCAGEGRKIELIRRDPKVGFEMDTAVEIYHTGDPAENVGCECTARFQSVIGTGTAHIVETDAEKRTGLRRIMGQCTGRENWDFAPEMVRQVCVIRVDVEKLSCKEHE